MSFIDFGALTAKSIFHSKIKFQIHSPSYFSVKLQLKLNKIESTSIKRMTLMASGFCFFFAFAVRAIPESVEFLQKPVQIFLD